MHLAVLFSKDYFQEINLTVMLCQLRISPQTLFFLVAYLNTLDQTNDRSTSGKTLVLRILKIVLIIKHFILLLLNQNDPPVGPV